MGGLARPPESSEPDWPTWRSCSLDGLDGLAGQSAGRSCCCQRTLVPHWASAPWPAPAAILRLLLSSKGAGRGRCSIGSLSLVEPDPYGWELTWAKYMSFIFEEHTQARRGTAQAMYWAAVGAGPIGLAATASWVLTSHIGNWHTIWQCDQLQKLDDSRIGNFDKNSGIVLQFVCKCISPEWLHPNSNY